MKYGKTFRVTTQHLTPAAVKISNFAMYLYVIYEPAHVIMVLITKATSEGSG